jgi:NTE family protein
MRPGAKFGLALSGGGFRASLFHLGVLACLADLNQLKSVRYLSTVSGGSIVGAAYYLKVKQLLDGTREDGLAPSDAAYVQIVEELIDAFLTGVQTNIRMRTFLNPLKNIRMLQEDYSRSDRISELYSATFYEPIWESMQRGFGRLSKDSALDSSFRESMERPLVDGGIPLRDLKIFPKGEKPEDSGAYTDVDAYNDDPHNAFKIPVLILNATTLNTGHNWQFTASYAGEPAVRVFRCVTAEGRSLEKVDSTPAFPRLRYDDRSLPEKVKKKLSALTLGDAVASSACVPMLFQPMAIHDLYPTESGEEVVIELVDGGVFDNQGLETLIDKQATEILCSDASLQLGGDPIPSTQAYSVLLRSNDIVMDALREQELGEFVSGRVGYALSRADLLHWQQKPMKDSRLSQDLLEILSRVRTDLDSFHDREAYALMYAGYGLCHERVGRSVARKKERPWAFWVIESEIADRTLSLPLKAMLEVSSNNAFKVLLLKDAQALIYAGVIGALLVILVGGGIWCVYDKPIEGWIPDSFKTVGPFMLTILGLLACLYIVQNRHVRKWLKGISWLRNVRNVLAKGLSSTWVAWLPALLMVFVSLAVWVHLKVFDRRYLAVGAAGLGGGSKSGQL